ncbi:GGDEF domain-containing protein [Granulicella sibirica]|uniref:diguanylate cyclase n=1 Tax=Granulicella sibirica TaxID=2479048 RepID=A0A4Q0T2J5_9BACT|nr:GGDEF domain-containing protein [Granulicella sibirica]RXH57885.1 hypothetical protein GRAN_1195 [Granulicella sibirica]
MGIHTLHVEHVMLLAVYTLLTVANSWLYKGTKGIHWFSLYSFSALLGALSVALRGDIPDFISIVIGNLFVVAGYFFFFLSLSELFGRSRLRLYLQGILLFGAIVTMVEWGSIHPNTRTRLIAYSVVLGLQQAHIAFVISRRQTAILRTAGAPVAMMLGLLALTNLVRIVGVYHYGAPSDYLKAGAFLGWIVIITSCLQCGAMVGYVWMTAALLRNDLQVQASTDPLTGLLNRRAIEREAEPMLTNCRQLSAPACAILIDLDGFKQINDRFGHACGDTTLTEVAACLQREMRKTDLLARLGGDEFAILLPYTPLEAAAEIAERLRHAVDILKIPCGEDGSGYTGVTASFGIAETEPTTRTWEQLAMSCDEALYVAKRAGGNRALPAEQFA